MGARERLGNALKKLGDLRPKISHSTLILGLALALIGIIAFIVRVLPIRWGMDLSEFDPFHFYRVANYMVNTGILSWFNPSDPTSWLNWHITQSWYPYGVNEGSSGYPGLAMAAAFLYEIVSALGVNISLKNFMILLPPMLGATTCIVAYFLGTDIAGKPAGVLAALFLALNPSYIGRTSLGFYDNESIGVLAILLIILFFLRSLDEERPRRSALFYMIAAGLAVGFICAQWGASMYPIDMLAFFAFLTLALKRYSRRLLLSYSVTFGIGLFIAVHVPRLGVSFLTSSVVLPIAGVFILLLLAEVLRDVKSTSLKITYAVIFFIVLIGGATALSALGIIHSPAGKFITLLNPSSVSAIYSSVQENRVTAWGAMYFDYGVGLIFILFGLSLIIRNLTNRNLFLAIYALTGLYFGMVMVRLTVLLAPAFCILWGIGVVGLAKPFLTLLKEAPKVSLKKKQLGRVGTEFTGIVILMIFVLLTLTIALPYPRAFNSAYTPVTILSDSTGIGPSSGAMPEWVNALTWMRTALPANTVIISWWDYGYWITIEGNQTTVVDNGTLNTTAIALVGAILMSNQTQSISLLEKHFNGPYGPPKYIVIFGTWYNSGSSTSPSYQGEGYGDEGKWRWFVDISGNYTLFSNGKPADGKDSLFGNYSIGVNSINGTQGSSSVQTKANTNGTSTTFYKLLTYAEDRILLGQDASTAAGNVGMLSYNVTSSTGSVSPQDYFTEAAFFPSSSISYGGVYPIVAVYKINYPS